MLFVDGRKTATPCACKEHGCGSRRTRDEEGWRKHTSRPKSLGDDDLTACSRRSRHTHHSRHSRHSTISKTRLHISTTIVRSSSNIYLVEFVAQGHLTRQIPRLSTTAFSTAFHQHKASRLDMNDHMYNMRTLMCGNVWYIALRMLSSLIAYPSLLHKYK